MNDDLLIVSIGARWDTQAGVITEARLKELTPAMPVISVRAVPNDRQETRNIYECPLYKTKIRGPTYVWTLSLKTRERPAKWVLAGVALLLSVWLNIGTFLGQRVSVKFCWREEESIRGRFCHWLDTILKCRQEFHFVRPEPCLIGGGEVLWSDFVAWIGNLRRASISRSFWHVHYMWPRRMANDPF